MLCELSYDCQFMQAMYAQSSVAVGLKGANKAMGAINKVAIQFYSCNLHAHNIYICLDWAMIARFVFQE